MTAEVAEVSFDLFVDHYKANILAGKPVSLARNILLIGGLQKQDAIDYELQCADALHKTGLGDAFGVFVQYIGGGTNWGVYVGPHDAGRPRRSRAQWPGGRPGARRARR